MRTRGRAAGLLAVSFAVAISMMAWPQLALAGEYLMVGEGDTYGGAGSGSFTAHLPCSLWQNVRPTFQAKQGNRHFVLEKLESASCDGTDPGEGYGEFSGVGKCATGGPRGRPQEVELEWQIWDDTSLPSSSQQIDAIAVSGGSGACHIDFAGYIYNGYAELKAQEGPQARPARGF